MPMEKALGDRLTAVVCDDHPLFLKGVLACLASDPDIEVVATAVDGQACIAKLELYSPEILVADLQMPVLNGFELLEWARANRPRLRVFILSMHAELAYVRKAEELGAAGFVAKDDAENELLAAVRSKPGRFYTSGSIGRLQPALPLVADAAFRSALRGVSVAEMKVLIGLADNLTSGQIAERLHLSVRTVQAHRMSLSEKLGARGPHKLLELALLHRAEILRARR
jgi:DNA-binding NarL/FixJ family response regulator